MRSFFREMEIRTGGSVWSCTSILRLIPIAIQPGKIASLLPVGEGRCHGIRPRILLTNGVSLLQTKLSHREGHEAGRIGLEAMPLAALTQLQVAGLPLRGMESGITQENHAFFELANQGAVYVSRETLRGYT